LLRGFSALLLRLARDLVHQPQQQRGAFPHALHGTKVDGRGGQHPGKAAEAFQKGMGNGIGVASGDAEEEQQFQQFVVLQGVRPEVVEAVAKALSVPVHGLLRSMGMLHRTLK